MKKIIFAVLALVLVMTMSVAVFAAPSKSDAVEVISAKNANGADVEIDVRDTSIPWLTETIATRVINATGSNESVTAEELTVLWQKDISANELPVSITFNVDGSYGVALYVFHWNGSDWELIEAGTGEEIVATFTSLSPVSLVIKKISSGATSTSPKTGEPVTMLAVCSLAAVCGAGVCITKRKKNK